MANTVVHVTDRHTFKQCRRRWYYACVDRIQPASEVAAGPFWIGQSIHHALAEWYRYGSNTIEVWHTFPGSDQCDDETRNLCLGMLQGYMDMSAVKDNDWDVQAVEVPLEIKVPGTRVYLHGTIDLFIKIGDHQWIVDHKTAKQLPQVQALEMDDQMTAYLWLAFQAGATPRGCIYNVLRKKVPTVPEVLQSGRLSQNKMCDTTYDVYLAAINSLGQDPGLYRDHLEHLKQKETTFFWREIIARNPRELESFEEDLTYEIREMLSKNTRMYPTPNRDCAFCSYRILCKCQNEGGDTEYLKTALFVKKADGQR